MEAPMQLRGQSRFGPTFREAVLMHAVARLALHPLITNIQTSWVKMGPAGATACLAAGANDLGGTLMNESITRAAGAVHGQEMPPAAMEALIRSIGRAPWQRTTLYDAAPRRRVAASFAAPPLTSVINSLPEVRTRAADSVRSPTTSLANPPPPQVGLARLGHFESRPAQTRGAWGREHTEIAALPGNLTRGR
jgi:FO synthase